MLNYILKKKINSKCDIYGTPVEKIRTFSSLFYDKASCNNIIYTNIFPNYEAIAILVFKCAFLFVMC